MTILLAIDDDRTVRHMIRQGLSEVVDEVRLAETAGEGLRMLADHQPTLVLLDIKLPDMSGLECFKEIREQDPKLPVIFITASNSSETAIEAMQLGAYNYVMKPLDLPKLRKMVLQAIETRRMMSVPVGIHATRSDDLDSEDNLVGQSSEMLRVYAQVGRVSNQDVTVLVRGESGTGKELISRAIYQHSPRKDGPFLAVNCAALTDTLLESELFGHEKGAFTGADTRRIGKFEQCSGGTLFLDEVGDMSLLLQSKVLRLLQEQRFERVGGNETISTDVRIIAATHRDLDTMVQEGDFRGDLFYRLNGYTIEIPPLRERGNDLQVLLAHFVTQFSRELAKPEIEGIAPDAVDLLEAYDWPGNVRELQSVVRQSILNATGTVIVPEFLPEEIREYQPTPPAGDFNTDQRGSRATPSNPDQSTESLSDLGDSEADGFPHLSDSPSGDRTGLTHDLRSFLDEHLHPESEELYADTVEMMERYLLTRVLQLTGGNQSQASRILGITRGSLRTKIRSLNISIGSVISVED